MQFVEAQQALCSKLNLTFSDIVAGNNSLFSLSEIKDYISLGVQKAWDYKPWTFTQKAYKFTITSGMIAAGYIDYPNDFEDKSGFLLIVNGVPWKGISAGKRDFTDYQKWFSDNPTDTSKIWAEFDRFIFINMNALAAGQEGDIFGKLRSPSLVNDTDLLPFSPMTDNNENSGNRGIISFAYAEALSSDKKKNPQGAALEEKKALAILDNVWKPMGERDSQDNSQNRPFFNTQDMFSGRPNRNNTPPGNF